MEGDLFFTTAPQVNTFYFEFMLRELSLHEPETMKFIFLDKAGYHRAKDLQVPGNVRLVYLPSSNPELNPVERFWKDMKDKVAFNNFKDEQELETWIEQTVRSYTKEQVASLTRYPYIKDAVGEAMVNRE